MYTIISELRLNYYTKHLFGILLSPHDRGEISFKEGRKGEKLQEKLFNSITIRYVSTLYHNLQYPSSLADTFPKSTPLPPSFPSSSSSSTPSFIQPNPIPHLLSTHPAIQTLPHHSSLHLIFPTSTLPLTLTPLTPILSNSFSLSTRFSGTHPVGPSSSSSSFPFPFPGSPSLEDRIRGHSIARATFDLMFCRSDIL